MQAEKTASVVKRRVDHYLELAERVHAHHDADTIHDFRVASRNLLVVAPLIADQPHPAWHGEIKNWLKALNHLRDLQVLEERLQSNAEVQRMLKQKIEHALQAWKRARSQVAPKPFRHELKEVCRQAIYRIRRSPEKFEADLSRQYDAIHKRLVARIDEVDTTRPETVHRLRVAYKSFRYLCALLHDAGALPDLNWEELKQWQDHFGAIQDDEVASAWLQENRPQERELIRSIQLHSEQLRQRFQAELPQFRKFVTDIFESVESLPVSVQPVQ